MRIHPESGERTPLLGSFTQSFVGLSRRKFRALSDIFQAYVMAPENTVRWHCQARDVAIWDNRTTQHDAVNDYDDRHRVVRRVTIDRDVPVGVDGKRSLTRTKLVKSPKPAAS